MLVIKLLRYLLGFVRIRITGDCPERLLTLMNGNEISAWSISSVTSGVEVSLYARDYRRLRQMRRRLGLRLTITARGGLPFMLDGFKYRFGIPTGLLIFIIGCIVFPKYAWNVRVTGNSEISSRALYTALRELGVREGAKISSLDTARLPSQLMLRVDGIAWCAVNIEGTRVTVEITESVRAELEGKEPSNLIAERDGTVVRVSVTGGALKTRVGATVQRGELLVSGIVDYKNGGSGLVRSAGSIFARTREKITVRSDRSLTYTRRTGKSLLRRVLKTPFVDIPLFLGDPDFEYERQSVEKRLETAQGYLPISLITACFYETETRTVLLSDEQAERAALEKLEKREREVFAEGKIIERALSFVRDSDGVTLTADYICEINIAREEKLLIGTVN